MVESGVFLSEAMFARNAPVRQWVVSVPIPLRFWMAINSELMGQVNAIITRAIGAHYKKAVRHFLLEGEELQTASVSVIQRFGGALNLNIHFHQLWVDGAYAGAEDEETGHIQAHLLKAKELTSEEIHATLTSIQKRVVRLLMRRGLLKLKRTTPELASCFSAALKAFAPLQSMDYGELLQRGGRGGLFMSRSATTACALSTLKAHGISNLCPTRARMTPGPMLLAGAHWRPARHACGTWGMERHFCLNPV
jgi:hypothetical protein